MNEKDTIIKLQSEVNEGLKKELNTVYYCADELMKECKRLKKSSKGHFVMGIGAGMIICGLVDIYNDKKIDKIVGESEENQCNEK